jgi:hypothetical protein
VQADDVGLFQQLLEADLFDPLKAILFRKLNVRIIDQDLAAEGLQQLRGARANLTVTDKLPCRGRRPVYGAPSLTRSLCHRRMASLQNRSKSFIPNCSTQAGAKRLSH